jgi:hypothetical protein
VGKPGASGSVDLLGAVLNRAKPAGSQRSGARAGAPVCDRLRTPASAIPAERSTTPPPGTGTAKPRLTLLQNVTSIIGCNVVKALGKTTLGRNGTGSEMTNGIFFISHPFRIDHNRNLRQMAPKRVGHGIDMFSRSRSAIRSGICVEIAPFESAVNPEILRSRSVTCQNIPHPRSG